MSSIVPISASDIPEGLNDVYEAGIQVFFSCNVSYQLVGEEMLVCYENGSWSAAVPQCKGELDFKWMEWDKL